MVQFYDDRGPHASPLGSFGGDAGAATAHHTYASEIPRFRRETTYANIR